MYQQSIICDECNKVAVTGIDSKLTGIKKLQELHGWTFGAYHLCPKCARQLTVRQKYINKTKDKYR